jgi:hypothetical protein
VNASIAPGTPIDKARTTPHSAPNLGKKILLSVTPPTL